MINFLRVLILWTLPGSLVFFFLWFAILKFDKGADPIAFQRLQPVSCNSMIFGASRAAQGVNPSVLESLVPHYGKWFNFSFNLSVSPWNNSYVSLIKRKLSGSIKGGDFSAFLLTINPWTLDSLNGGEQCWFDEPWVDPCGTNSIRYTIEKTVPLDLISKGQGMNLLSASQKLFYKLTDRPYWGTATSSGITNKGWLPNKGRPTDLERRENIKRKLSGYSERQISPSWPDYERMNALSNLIVHIKSSYESSRVLIIRLPTTNAMRELEEMRFPKCSVFLDNFAKDHELEFYDIHQIWKDRKNELFNDAHHLSDHGANKHSKFLADLLNQKLP